jgi:GNAT superfamily N-acetyltransferase
MSNPEQITIERLTRATLDAHLGELVMHPDLVQGLVERIDDPFIMLVAKRAGRVVGQVAVDPGAPRRAETLAHLPQPTPAIANMHVDRSMRRQGIGGQLLEAACAVAVEAGASTAYLNVRVDNPTARDFYGHKGFEDWGHGTFSMPMRDQQPDGSWGEPETVPVNVLIRDLTQSPPTPVTVQ